MRDFGRIEQRIRVSVQRWLAQRLSKHPPLLEVGYVADLPERWIDDAELGAEHLRVVEIGDELDRSPARILHPLGEQCRVVHGRRFYQLPDRDLANPAPGDT